MQVKLLILDKGLFIVKFSLITEGRKWFERFVDGTVESVWDVFVRFSLAYKTMLFWWLPTNKQMNSNFINIDTYIIYVSNFLHLW